MMKCICGKCACLIDDEPTEYEVALDEVIGLARDERRICDGGPYTDGYYLGYISALTEIICLHYDTGDDDDDTVMRKIVEGARIAV